MGISVQSPLAVPARPLLCQDKQPVAPETADAVGLLLCDQTGGGEFIRRPQVRWLLSNARGLKQAAIELKVRVECDWLDFVGIVETFQKDNESIKMQLPRGFKVAARFDRAGKGGGQVILSRNHLLVDAIDLKKYCVPRTAELVGIEYDGIKYILCYTPNSTASVVLFKQLSKEKEISPKWPLPGNSGC